MQLRTNNHLVLPFVHQKLFPPEICKKIIDHCKSKWELKKKGKIGDDIDPKGKRLDLSYRNVNLHMPEYEFGTGSDFENSFLKTMIDTIMGLNGAPHGWHFHLDGPHEPPILMEYETDKENPAQYKAHMDLGLDYPSANRKIAYSVHLNYGEYEGGELEMLLEETWQPLHVDFDFHAGMMILFPAYIMHCVTPVTKGTRYTLTGWVHGDSFA